MSKYIILFLLVISNSYSQKFDFKEVIMKGTFLKVKGNVDIKENSIEIITGGIPKLYKVELFSNEENKKIYKEVVDKESDVQIRFTLVEDPGKQGQYILIYDRKDNFTNTIINGNYFLIPQVNALLYDCIHKLFVT